MFARRYIKYMYIKDKEHLINNPHIKRQSEIVDLLIKLSCEEHGILEKQMFSDTKKHSYLKAQYVVTYILYTDFEIGMTQIHRIFSKRGYNKNRSSLYNGVKLAKRNIKKRGDFYYTYEYILEEVLNFSKEEVKKEGDNWKYALKGRVFTLLNKVEEVSSLKDIERLITMKLYEEKKVQEAN